MPKIKSLLTIDNFRSRKYGENNKRNKFEITTVIHDHQVYKLRSYRSVVLGLGKYGAK